MALRYLSALPIIPQRRRKCKPAATLALADDDAQSAHRTASPADRWRL